MDFVEYSAILKEFKSGSFDSISDDYDEICRAQDLLIAELTSKGAEIKGWKVVDDSGVLILSPIFDFQLFKSHDVSLSQKELLGIEVEICYQCCVPKSISDVKQSTDFCQPLASIEILRPKINDSSCNACDFYFNYGISVSSHAVSEDFKLENGNAKEITHYLGCNSDFFEEKKDILKKGVLECIRRGYVDDEYFFMTGSLNGLIATNISIGSNDVIHKGERLVSLEIL
ncbi:hypothetical protein TW85_23915 [Marinomonas sp. S3726]|uniref:hypothetical protein n=1 Tax=Marinomonas sp. S3726 TaxID=579484 RepID=UPI0005F9E395|nr:hypothetical protein [Marinomonas sp. S3726]KJZ08160.1 hypothetical protein TW85_23915 [Marinomonas sp. S3726]